MNKLLQHIIDAGDVDHKILPGLQKMQKAGIVMFKPAANEKAVYDNIPNPAVVRSQMAKDAAAKQLLAKRAADQAARDRHGYVYQAPAPRSMASKAWAIATNPMTALAYKVQGRDIPDNFELGKKNSLDIAANMVNPFAIANAVGSIPGNVARGEFLDAGLNSLNLVPALSAARQAGKVAKAARPINKTVQAFGPNNSNKGLFNFLTTREGVDFDPGAILKDYKVGFSEGLLEGVPHALGTALRKTGIYPKARTIGRPFSEVFPTGVNKAKAIQAQDQAFDNAIGFVNEYFYPGGSDELRPVLADKIRTMFPNATGSPENFSKLSSNNPFNETVDRLAKSTTWGSGREGLDLYDINYINRNRGTMGGFNSLGSSITLRNYGPYYKTPYDVARTAVHEAGHTSQKLGYVPSFKNPAIINTPITWGSEIAKYDEGLNYYTSNPDTGLGRLFGKSMVTPGNPSFINKIINRGKRVDDAWESSPNELHSELIAEKYADYLRSFDKKNPNVGLQSGTLNKELIDQLANPSDDILKRILDRGNLDKHFRPETTLEQKLKLLRMLPAAAPVVAAGALGANEQRYGGENNMFKVFAQEGVEYKGPSIVDYLATKGYSGKKQFRKELADKYGIEGYDFSAAKNTELLNRLRESDELLRQYDQTMAPIPVERMMEMEQQARAARQAAAAQPNTQPVRRPAPVYNFSPEFQNMRIPEIKVNTSLQPKVVYDGKFSLTPKMVIPMPFGFNKTTPTPEVPNSEITDPVRNTPARPKLNLPQYNPFVRPEVRPELGPFISDRYNDVQEVDPLTEQGTPEFLFNSEKLFNSFNRPKQKPLLPVVIPAKKPVVKTEKYTKPEAEELPWYEEAANAVTSTLKGFYDNFAEAVEKSPLDFGQMNFGTPMSPQGAKEMTRDFTKRGLSLFSPDMAEKYDNWLNRQQAIQNMDKDPVSKIVVPDFDYAPMYITGDTIPDSERQYHLAESMDLNALKFGVRNRGDLSPLDTEAASITAFHPFVDAKLYFTQIADDPANATYLGITPDGQVQVGGRKDVENKDIKISRVFSNRVVDFVRDPTGGIKKVPAGAKVNKNAFSPAVTVIGDDGKQKEGKLNLVVPQGTKADDAFGVATGGRFIFQTPDGQSRLVSGSLNNIEQEFKRIKGNNPYVTVISLDNGSFSRGLRTRDKRLTATDLRSYDNLNTGGGNFAYLLPNQQTSRPLAKFDEFEKEATKRLQALYPGKKVSVEYQDTGDYNQVGGRDIQTQADIQKKGNSQTPVSLHNFNAARDYVLYVDGKPINGNEKNKVGNDIYKEVLWKAADKTGVYHIDPWDVGHIGLAKEGQKTAFDELKSKYPEIFTDPNFVKSLEFINKNKNNPNYQEYYELLNNIQKFTGAPRTTEFMKQKSTAKKAYGGPVDLPKMQMAGTLLQPITAQDMGNVLSLFSVPQKVITKAFTGKYQTPSEAMGIKNSYGAFAVDAVLDPVNLVGAGLLGKMAKASTKTGILSNAYKYNPYAFKPNAQSYYRGIGRSGVDDALEKGILRPPVNTPYGKDRLYMTETLGETNMYSKDLPTYKGDPFGGANDEWIEILPKDGKRYIAEIPKNKTNFVIENDIFNSGSGYSTIFPKLSDVKLYQQDWLRGYKPIKLPNKKSGGPILDPRGQWAHPGKVTRIPGSDITMQGVPYPVYGVGSNGQEQMMYPDQEYNFGGASYVDEYPIMQGGGWSGGGLSRSNLAMMSALNKDIKDQKARDAQVTISQYTPKPGDQQRMNANKDAYRKEQGKFLNRLADNQHMQAAGKNLPGAAEFALDVMTAGEAGVALKAAKPLLKAAGKYLTQKTPLRNAYKFNPYALTDNMLFNKKGVVNRQMFGDEAFENFKQYGPTTRPNVSQYDQMMEFIKAPKSDVISGSGEAFQVAKTMEDGAFKYPYFQEGNLWYTGQQRNNLANQLGTERIITTPKSDIWFAPAGEGTVMHGDDLSQGLINSYSKGRRVLMPGSEYAKPSKYSVFEPHWWKGYKQVQEEGGQISMMANGGYTVTRSSDRKGKTHKVTGPGGVVKYFGDSKLGQHPKDPERKAAFYARHKKNLAGNPFFRAFARKTWQDGGQTDYMQGGGLWDTNKVGYLDSTINANRNLEFIRRAIENDGLSIPTPKGAPGYGKGMTSSHLMTFDPKSRRSYPELVNMNGTLKYLTGDDAYNYAEDTGEYIQFPTAEQADYFSQNYKKSNYVKVGKQPLEKKHGIKVTYKK